MATLNSLELLSQACSFVQMNENQRPKCVDCPGCGAQDNRSCNCQRNTSYQPFSRGACIRQSRNSAFSPSSNRNIIRPNPIKYNMPHQKPYLTPTIKSVKHFPTTENQDVDAHFRKSLGSNYNAKRQKTTIEYTIQHGASVDDHFKRSLGKDWEVMLKEGKSTDKKR